MPVVCWSSVSFKYKTKLNKKNITCTHTHARESCCMLLFVIVFHLRPRMMKQVGFLNLCA